jgi:hypothetical protein
VYLKILKLKWLKAKTRFLVWAGSPENATDALLEYAEESARLKLSPLNPNTTESVAASDLEIGNIALEPPQYARRLMEGIASKVYPYSGTGEPEWLRLERVLASLTLKERAQLWLFNLFYPKQPPGVIDFARFPSGRRED